MAAASLCFSVYWAGSNDLVVSKLVLTQDHARCNSVELQNQVARLVKVEPRNIKILLGSLAGPQLTPVLFPPSLVRSTSTIEDLPYHKKIVATWLSLATSNQALKVYVTQHSPVALAVDALARAYRSGHWYLSMYTNMPPSVQCNPVVALAALDLRDSVTYGLRLPNELSTNKQFFLAAMSQSRCDNTLLQCFSDTFCDSEDIVFAAVVQDKHELYHASQRLKSCRTFVLKAVSVNGLCIQWAAPELKQDKEIALAAVWQNALAIQYLCKTLQNNQDIQRICETTQQNV